MKDNRLDLAIMFCITAWMCTDKVDLAMVLQIIDMANGQRPIATYVLAILILLDGGISSTNS